MVLSFYDAKTKKPLTDLDNLIDFDKSEVGKEYEREFIVKNDNEYESVSIKSVVLGYNWKTSDYSVPEPDIELQAPIVLEAGKSGYAKLKFKPKTQRKYSLKAKVFMQTEVG